MKAQIIINRDPAIPFFQIYVPDGHIYWKVIASRGTQSGAERYCKDNDLEIEDEKETNMAERIDES